MRFALDQPTRLALLAAGLWLVGSGSSAFADEPAAPAEVKSESEKTDEAPSVSLYDAVRQGDVAVKAEGRGDGRMTVSLTNKSKRPLKVILPPGLIASGTTGQFGGMGGMGGGMGGMGGGMGGMGGGMMGGMGGGMGGGMMGGGMGGGMMGGGTMPASMGMMMLSQLIMSLVGDRDSWDQSSVMMGMGGMGGRGMGGMGMGGMMGGRGGGFRSVPATSVPFASLKPNQTRHLPTRLVRLSDSGDSSSIRMPAKGEKLRLGDISQLTDDPTVQKALKRLAEDKAPQTVSQLVMMNLVSGKSWDDVATLSKGWANDHERTLAETFVANLSGLKPGESGVLLYEVSAKNQSDEAVANELRTTLKDTTLLGLRGQAGVPASPEGPALAFKASVDGDEAVVQVANSDGRARSWAAAGKFTVPVARTKDGKVDGPALADALTEGILDRVVRAQLASGPRAKGKATYKIKIDNASPWVLNGVAVLGKEGTLDDSKILSGISVAPRRSLTLPATDEMVKALGLKKGIRVTGADLSGL